MVTAATTRMVQVRLDTDLVKELDHITVDLDVYRAEIIAELLRRGLPLFRTGTWSVEEQVSE